MRDAITLKNFTIFSLALLGFAFLSVLLPLDNSRDVFVTSYLLGILLFLCAYFLYAVKCWGSDGQVCAVLMLTLPLVAYFFATSAVPESTSNILFYLFMQFCYYAIISLVVLYISDKVIAAISRQVFRKGQRHSYFFPNLSYATAGVVFASVLVIMMGSPALFSDNVTTIADSWGKTGTLSSANSAGSPVTTVTISQSQIIPTLEPQIINSIDRSIGNSQPPVSIPGLESEVHLIVNQQRANHGYAALSFDSSLADIARKHSLDMARNNYFSHDNMQGLDPTGRADQAGYSCYKTYGSYYTTGIAENIFQNNLYDSVTYYNGVPRYDWNTEKEIALSTVNGWMESPGHRKNILTPTYDREGIGVAIADNGKVYITQNFC